MFLTANALVTQYGLDERIAKFYVDREPPRDNLYWKDKLLYLRPQPGYIFLPLVTDLFFRIGIPLPDLLSDRFVSTLEKIGHYSAEQEFGIISGEQAMALCSETVNGNEAALSRVAEVIRYFKGQENAISPLATPFRALHRGDLFLFGICQLEVPEEKWMQMVRAWFALISTLLLMDDAEDYTADREAGEENAFIESGSNREGFERIKALLADNLHQIAALNQSMANALHGKFAAMADKPGIKEYLNA